jgi:predicted Rossmann-fold nucleotide-binding protein
MTQSRSSRRAILAVIGNAGTLPIQVTEIAKKLGGLAVDVGFRLVTGGLDGVMGAVSEGAHESAHYQEGMVLGIIPSNVINISRRLEWAKVYPNL